MAYKIWDFHDGGNYEESRLLGCGVVCVFLELTFRRNLEKTNSTLSWETSVLTRPTRHHTPEGGILHSSKLQNLPENPPQPFKLGKQRMLSQYFQLMIAGLPSHIAIAWGTARECYSPLSDIAALSAAGVVSVSEHTVLTTSIQRAWAKLCSLSAQTPERKPFVRNRRRYACHYPTDGVTHAITRLTAC
jgi:hypothetical protein